MPLGCLQGGGHGKVFPDFLQPAMDESQKSNIVKNDRQSGRVGRFVVLMVTFEMKQVKLNVLADFSICTANPTCQLKNRARCICFFVDCLLWAIFARLRGMSMPPWRQPRGKSYVNLPQMLPPGGSIGMGVDSRNHLFGLGLSLGWLTNLYRNPNMSN